MRRWKVIDGGNPRFEIGRIISLYEDDYSGAPKFHNICGKDGWDYCNLSRLVEIDENRNTIRTYTAWDKLDEGTLVGGTMNKVEAKKRLDAIEAETKALREILDKPNKIIYDFGKLYVLEYKGHSTYRYILLGIREHFTWYTLSNAEETFDGTEYKCQQDALDCVLGREDCTIHEFDNRDDALKFMMECK